MKAFWVTLIILLFACLIGFLSGHAPDATSAEPSGSVAVRAIFPPSQAVLVDGEIDVICRAPGAALTVNGKPHAWESFAPPLRVSRLTLPEGAHELRIGDQPLKIVVANGDGQHNGPKQWEVFHTHPIENGEDRCADCHES